MTSVALVLAGGSGQRAGLGRNKVLAELAGTTILEHSVAVLGAVCDHVIVVARPADRAEIRALLGDRVDAVVDGGVTRHGSEASGMAAAEHLGCDVVLVHDGARPLVSHAMVLAMVDEARAGRAAVPALPRTAPIARWATGSTGPVLDDAPLLRRDGIVGVQTPQAAPADALREAFALAAKHDDAPAGLMDTVEPLLRHLPDLPVVVVPGDPRNIKVTWPSDVSLAERLVGFPSAVPGSGALRLRAGRPTGGAPVAQLEVDGVTPVTDALRVARDGRILSAVDRTGLVDVAGDLLVTPGVLDPAFDDIADAVEAAVDGGARLRLRRRR